MGDWATLCVIKMLVPGSLFVAMRNHEDMREANLGLLGVSGP